MPIHRDPAGRATLILNILPKGRTVPETWDWVLVGLVGEEGFPTPVREYRAFPPRRWRFDFAWPSYKIALEIDGGVYTLGRHTRGAGFEADCRKMNEAAASGWAVFHITPMMLYKEWPEIVQLLREAFALRKGADAATRA